MANINLESYRLKQAEAGTHDLETVVARWLKQTTVGKSHASLASPKAPMLVLRHRDGSHSAHFSVRCDLWNHFGNETDSRVVLVYDGQHPRVLAAVSPCENCVHALACSLASERQHQHTPAQSWAQLSEKS
jgi:hypothetical protein